MRSSQSSIRYRRKRANQERLISTAVTTLLVFLAICMIMQIGFFANLPFFSPFMVQLSRRNFENISSRILPLLLKKKPDQSVIIAVPHILWFTYETNIMLSKEPDLFYENVMHTIDAYNRSWRDNQQSQQQQDSNSGNMKVSMQVRFLDDADCENVVFEAFPDIVTHFSQETNGAFRGDICRVAALYLHGGYYFDIDMEVIRPYIAKDLLVPERFVSNDTLRVVEPSIFVSSWNADRNSIFQSFIASTAYSPILKESFYFMMAYYEGRNENCTRANECLMGTKTMLQAYERYAQESQQQKEKQSSQSYNTTMQRNIRTADKLQTTTPSSTTLLFEDKLTPELYPGFPRRPGVDNFYCNYIVHSPTENFVHFYSRIIGSKNCPYMTDENSTIPQKN